MADQKESPSCNFQKHVPVGEAIQLSSGPAIAMGAWNSGVSILDSDIRRCIGKVTGNKNESVAQKVWGICKSLGVSFSGNDEVMVQMVENLEKRDQAQIAKSDVLVFGKCFTWFTPDGSVMSQIDRFLLS